MKEMNEKLTGIFAPITTPFTSDGEVDYTGLKKNMEFTQSLVLRIFSTGLQRREQIIDQ